MSASEPGEGRTANMEKEQAPSEGPPEPEQPAVALSQRTVELLRREFGDAVRSVAYFRDETTIEVEPGRVMEVCRFLRDHPNLKYNFLADLCGVDRLYLDVDGPRFAVVYTLYSIPCNRRVRLKACVDGTPPAVDSVTPVWTSANWQEREAYDLVGIHFRGHPNLERILTPEGFEGHPHRKDFPVGDEPVEFTGAQEFLRYRHPTTIEESVSSHRRPGPSPEDPARESTHD
ncbi:MAG: NADH-quinone oxidoreductase subunit C [Nitrospinota bacterium]